MLSRVVALALFFTLVFGLIGPVAVVAQTTNGAAVPVSGVVTDATGTPVAGAAVTLRGNATATTTTDAAGHYTLSVVPGVYSVFVRAAGFDPSTDQSVTVTGGGATVDARLRRPTFSSLQTIGSTSATSGSGPAFYTSAIARTTVDQQTFENQGDIGVRDVLNEIPGIVISNANGSSNGGSPGAITYPNIRGGLSYETASLIDGHAVSVGKYGDYVTTFLSRYMFQSIEVEKGPASKPVQISRTVNGTVNFRTWDPTTRPTGNAEFGLDGYGGSYANLRFSDTVFNKKVGFVFDVATYGTPGPGGKGSNPQSFVANLTNVSYTDSAGFPVNPSTVTQVKAPGAVNTFTSLSTNTIACCVPTPTNYLNRSELAKVRINFSDVTSLTATMLASQTWSSQNGNTNNLVPVNFQPTVQNQRVQNGTNYVFYPFNDNFAYDYEFNNEPIFEGEFHTGIKNDNLAFRYYSAVISRLQTNNDQTNAPFTVPVQLYGQTSTGQPLNGNDPFGNPYVATIADPLYQSQEYDNLSGYSFEYDHALGTNGNVVSLTVDENYSKTHVYTPGEPDTSSTSNIPLGSQQNTGTYQLSGQFQIGPRLNLTAAYYLTRFSSQFATFDTASTFVFNNTVNWHNDERFGASYRLNHDANLRFALGSSLTPPFLGILSGSASTPTVCTASTCPSGFQPGTVAVNSIGGLNVVPETSFGYDLGADYRFPAGSYMVFSGDVYLTNLQNQFLRTVYANGSTVINGQTFPLFTTAYGNLGNSRYEGIEFQLQRVPPVGLGFAVQGALLRSFPYNVSPNIYQYNSAGVATVNQGVVSGQQFGPNSLLSAGGSAIPFSQGYAEINYRGGSGFYSNIGLTYYGPNNTYNQTAFNVVRGTVRVPVWGSKAYVQASVNNLFNTNGSTFDLQYSGVPYPNVGGTYYATNLKGYGPRAFQFVFVINQR